MRPDILILAATAILAVVALIAAVVSVRNVREVRRAITNQASSTEPVANLVSTVTEPVASEPELLTPVSDVDAAEDEASVLVNTVAPTGSATNELVPHHGQVARVVDGEVVVTPTRSQVANAIMGQPRVRFAIWMTGITHALRPESRDRIVGMMRRDYRERRRFREQAARHAIRTAHSPSTRADEWTGS